MLPRDVVILGAARTPIGEYGGAFRDLHPAELGAVAARAALARAGVGPEAVDEVLIGHARQAGSGPNPARQVAHRAGIPVTAPAQTINKACASGMQAVATAAQTIAAGDADLIVAGGIESMSRMPYLIDPDDARWGHRMGNFPLVDAMYRDGFHCPLSGLIMGETVEVLAREYGISREDSDAYALESQRRAQWAIKAGRFVDEIATLDISGASHVARRTSTSHVARRTSTSHVARSTRTSHVARSTSNVTEDEHPRFGTTIESLRKLPPVFELDGQQGIVTAGSSSGITDAGAALVLASAGKAKALGRKPLARIAGWASAGVDPRLMGIGPVPAVQKLLARLGLTLDQFDLVELNEAFAAQVLAVLRDLPIPVDRLNVNGGAIALGHPIGCTGARILVTLLYEMQRRQARRGLATLCVSGGMGMAMALEAIQ